jgi:hypothetical protein
VKVTDAQTSLTTSLHEMHAGDRVRLKTQVGRIPAGTEVVIVGFYQRTLRDRFATDEVVVRLGSAQHVLPVDAVETPET